MGCAVDLTLAFSFEVQFGLSLYLAKHEAHCSYGFYRIQRGEGMDIWRSLI
jgi:hypothetical protein